MLNFKLFILGPMFIFSLLLFIIGSIYLFLKILFLFRTKDQNIILYFSFKYSLRSIFHWVLPFGSLCWRENPITSIMTFILHYGGFITFLFIIPHAVIFENIFKVRWLNIPNLVSDIISVIVIISLIFFMLRRCLNNTVKFLSDKVDYIFLFLMIIIFTSGFLAHHCYYGYNALLIIHILSGEILLVLIPFTRLKHMFLFFITRSYAASEFGKVRNTRDW